MLALIKEIAHQVVFLVLILAVCYSNQDTHVFRQNEGLRGTLLYKVDLVSQPDEYYKDTSKNHFRIDVFQPAV